MTDDQRIESIKYILGKMNHAAKKWHDETVGLTPQQTADLKNKKLFEITNKYPNVTKNTIQTERFFMISGKDVIDSGCQWSCGTMAKSFCYINSTLPPEKQLNVKIMISVHPGHLIDAMVCHTLPCVEMGDGKLYAIEPNPKIIENRPQHPIYRDIPIILDDVFVGKKIHHILKALVAEDNTPFEIRQIVSYQEYEQKLSDFGHFLKAAVKRDPDITAMMDKIEPILQKINSGANIGNAYSFCVCAKDSGVPVNVTAFKTKHARFNAITMRIYGDLYFFMPIHNYVMLHKLQDLGNNKFFDADNNETYIMLDTCTPIEYIQRFNTNIANMDR